jgi:hypothetical protein
MTESNYTTLKASDGISSLLWRPKVQRAIHSNIEFVPVSVAPQNRVRTVKCPYNTATVQNVGSRAYTALWLSKRTLESLQTAAGSRNYSHHRKVGNHAQ